MPKDECLHPVKAAFLAKSWPVRLKQLPEGSEQRRLR